MLKRMVNKHRMLIAVLDFFAANVAKLTFAPALAGLITQLRDTMTSISNMEQSQLMSSKGHTQTKEALKQQVINSILEIIKRAKAYAIVTDNLILKDAVDYTYSQLDKMPQDSLVSVANKLVTTCVEHISAMAGYGLTQQMLDAVSPQLTGYAAALPGTKRAIASRKTATDGLVNAFATADSLVKKIDAMMELVSTEDPPFYQEYKNLRVIVDLKGKAKTNGNGGMGITGTVSSMETGLNQPGVKVSLAGTNLSTLTDAQGNYTLAVSQAGTYSLLAALNGYADYTEDDIEVNPGELTEVDFDMEPAK